MKANRKALGALSLFAAAALALTACGGGDSSSSDNGSAAASGGASADSNAASTSDILTGDSTEPQNPLIPTNTTEVGGGRIINLLFSGLVSFDSKGAPQMDQAESITPNADNTVWTVKLKDGIKFTDGTPVTSDSYINAWNYGSAKDNAQGSSYFFDNIKGFSYDKNVPKLAGLKKVSDSEFTVTLNHPESDFQLRLGYSAFVPLPDSAFKDMKAYGESPVGNGPYKLASADAWTHNKGIKLVKNDDYQGPKEAKNGGWNFTFYSDMGSAYQDVLSGNLDVLSQIPPSAFATYQSDFPDSNVNQAAAIFQSFTIPQYLDHFKTGKEGTLRREAISMAIDRDTITQKIFSGTRTPAKDFTTPVLEGWDTWGKGLKGNDVLSYNPDEAKKLWAEADAISKYTGTLTIGYNADGGHKEWVDAVTNGISGVLGIKAEGQSFPAFKQLLDKEASHTMTGGFRSGWQADYPAMFNFLSPLYQTGAGSNYGQYSSKVVDDALKAGAAAKTPEDATAQYTKAQEQLIQDLPAIPLWYQNVSGVWNPKLKNVQYGWDSVPLYYEITK